MSNSTSPLNYAPGDLRRRRRRALRMLLTVVLPIVAVLITGICFEPFIAAQCQLLLLQQAAATYTRPVGEVVFEEEPIAAAKLIQSGAYIPRGHVVVSKFVETWGAKPKQTDLFGFLALFSYWANRYQTYEDTDFNPFLYSGTRKAGGGSPRIVMVAGQVGISGRLLCHEYVVQPAGPLGTLALLQVGDWPKVQTGETKYVPFRDVRIFAGQADAENSARFSIDYVFLGTKHHVVGELKPDDTVAFSDTLQ